MRHTAMLCTALLVATTAFSQAPKPKTAAPVVVAPVTSPDLPVKRVVLYKNGVGYFEHAGRVRGTQEVNIDFTTGQLNDVLKSLTVVDMGGGQITGVRYNSIAPLSERLRSFRVQLDEDTNRAGFLAAMRGARVEVRSGGGSAVGKLLSVETIERISDKNLKESLTQFAIVTDSGEMRTFDLTPGVSVRVLDADLNREIGRYMEAISSSRAKDVRRMTVSTSGNGERDLFVSYISEVPVWKSTYRIMLPSGSGDKPLLQGWAIVDNTVGEDWKDVQLSLVAGSPQSFIQEISQPYYVRRPTVELPKSVMLTPQTHGPSFGSGVGGVVGGIAGGVAGGQMGGVIGGVLSTPTAIPRKILDDNTTAEMEIADVENAVEAAEASDLGQLFQYTPHGRLTVLKNQSALVPIVNSRVDAESVTIWNASDDLPRRAIWLNNTSSLTLDAGSVDVIEGGAFAGEGLVQVVHPNEKRLISYAADEAIQVRQEDQPGTRIASRVVVAKGMARFSREERSSKTYTVFNADKAARVVVLEHPARQGWKLANGTKSDETTADLHRFRVTVEPGSKSTIKVEEYHPLQTQYVLTNLTSHDLEIWVRDKAINPAIEQEFRRVLAKKNDISGVQSQINNRRQEIQRITNEQSRLRENMKALKGSAEEKALVQRYVQNLNQQEDRLASLNSEINTLETQSLKLNSELDAIVQSIAFDENI